MLPFEAKGKGASKHSWNGDSTSSSRNKRTTIQHSSKHIGQVGMYIYIYLFMYVYKYVYIYVYINMYIYMYI